MTAETQISSTATQNKVRHDVVCLHMIIERGKERWQKRGKTVRESTKLKRKYHIYTQRNRVQVWGENVRLKTEYW